LVFDDPWFLQALDGERSKVWQTLRRIEDHERHANVVVVEAIEVPTQTFGNWWMGFAVRNEDTVAIFVPYLSNGLLRPHDMSATAIVSLMMALAKAGLSRKLAVDV
jgi:hypothetical protein